jgi:hypothetical protein
MNEEMIAFDTMQPKIAERRGRAHFLFLVSQIRLEIIRTSTKPTEFSLASILVAGKSCLFIVVSS